MLSSGINLMEVNLSQRNYTKDFFASFGQEKISGIHISQSLFSSNAKTDLQFLSSIKNKSALKVLLVDVAISSGKAVDYIYLFENLIELSIINTSATTVFLDLNRLPRLRFLSVSGKIQCIGSETASLKSLRINHGILTGINSSTIEKLSLAYVNWPDLNAVKGLCSVKKLIITKAKITALAPLDCFKELENIEIAYCPQLVHIEELAGCRKLKKLEIECCKKIENYECLSELKALQGLVVSNCGNIPSIRFINDMPALKFFSFVDTNIVDGDLTPCLRLEYVGTMDKRHYNIKARDLPHRFKGSFHNI